MKAKAAYTLTSLLTSCVWGWVRTYHIGGEEFWDWELGVKMPIKSFTRVKRDNKDLNHRMKSVVVDVVEETQNEY